MSNPVTIWDLRVAEYPTYRPATIADLVSALRAEGYEVGNLCKVCADAGLRHHIAMLGFIQAEAQPFPPAGG